MTIRRLVASLAAGSLIAAAFALAPTSPAAAVPENRAPTATATSYLVNEDGTLNAPGGSLLYGATDPDGDALTVRMITSVGHGSLSVAANGGFTYTPARDFSGADAFTFVVNDGTVDSAAVQATITVAPVNDKPVVKDVGLRGKHGQPLNVSIADLRSEATDVDNSNDDLAIEIHGQPSNGTAVNTGSGHFLYTPNPAFVGDDSFTYIANDGQADSNPGRVIITVAPPNTAPVAADHELIAGEDLTYVAPPGYLLVDSSDAQGDPLTARVHAQPTNGTVVVRSNGGFTYTPNPNFNGLDSFEYVLNDGELDSSVARVEITVNAVNDPPVAMADTYEVFTDETLSVYAPGVLANDSDVDGDTLSVRLEATPSNGSLAIHSSGYFDFTPTVGYVGPVTFSYRVHDGNGGSAIARVTIDVKAPLPFTSTEVAITGTAKAGETLTAVAASAPTADDVTIEWFNGTTSLGTGRTYTLGDDAEGTSIHAVATFGARNYTTTTASSAAVGPIATRKAPTVTLAGSNDALRLGGVATLTWSSTRAASVKASGSWSGTLAASGSKKVTPAKVGLSTYSITVSNANGSVTSQVAIKVGLPATTLKVKASTKKRAGKVTVKISGLAAGERFTATLRGTQVTGVANQAGAATVKFAGPKVKKTRTVKVSVTGSLSDRRGSVKVKVRPAAAKQLKLKLSLTSTRASDPVTLRITNLAPGKKATVTYKGRVVASGTASRAGKLTVTFNPGTTWGTFPVRVTSGKQSATTLVTVTQRCAGSTTCA